jgi:hypothetical protein
MTPRRTGLPNPHVIVTLDSGSHINSRSQLWRPAAQALALAQYSTIDEQSAALDATKQVVARCGNQRATSIRALPVGVSSLSALRTNITGP